jgi:hypothetical protein
MKTRERSLLIFNCFVSLICLPAPAVAQYVPNPRNQCMIVSFFTGAPLGNGNSISISGGAPSPELTNPGEDCIETGHLGPLGIVYVGVDNPRLWTKFTLSSVGTKWNGAMPQELFADEDAGGWKVRFFNMDLNVRVTGGDTPGVSELGDKGADSFSGTLIPWPGRLGHWGAGDSHQVTLVTGGLRVGRTSLDAQLLVEKPNQAWEEAAFPVRVQLDPNVRLIPVQVLALYSPTRKPVTSREEQLALWDRFPTASGPVDVTDGQFGELTSSAWSLQNWIPGGEDGVTSVGGKYSPDDVFAGCGVQFRMVNYVEMQVDEEHLIPTRQDYIDGDTPLIETITQFKKSPDYMPEALIAVSTPACRPPGISSGGTQGEPGTAPPSLGDTACADNTAGPAVLSHELGHVLGLQHIADLGNLMVPAPDTHAGLTQVQCDIARNRALAFVPFWPQPPAPSGFMRQSTSGKQGNFEMVVPEGGSLVHYWRDNDAPGFPWHQGDYLVKEPPPMVEALASTTVKGAGLLQNRQGNLEVVAWLHSKPTKAGAFGGGGTAETDYLASFYRDATTLKWYGPIEVMVDGNPIAGVTGTPAFIQSTSGKQGNFEIIVPEGGSLVHYWRDNDASGVPWHQGDYLVKEPPPMVEALASTTVRGAALLQSRQGNLEVVAWLHSKPTKAGAFGGGGTAETDYLASFYRDATTLKWYGPIEIMVDGNPIAGVTGSPAFIQSTSGKQGNFEMIVPEGGSLVHYWRDNDASGVPWHQGDYLVKEPPPMVEALASTTVMGAALLQSRQGNLEVVAWLHSKPTKAEAFGGGGTAETDYLASFSRDATTLKWSGPVEVTVDGNPIENVSGPQ